MPTNELSAMLFDTLRQHLPAETGWVAVLALAICAAAGLVLLVIGARLAPILGALAFAFVGGYGASFLATAIGTPLWPTVVGGGVIGLGLGFALYRVWVALLVATSVMSIALGVYGNHSLRTPLQKYLSEELAPTTQLVTLKDAATATSAPAVQAELAKAWLYLAAHVPNFQASALTIAIATGLAGFIFGLLVPRAASALLAATIGAALVGTGMFGVVHLAFPAQKDLLTQWGPIVIAAVWGIALVFNLADMYGLKPKKPLAAPPRAAS